MVREKLLVYGAPAIESAEIDEVVAVMQSGWLGTGPRVAQFEEDFADYKGVDNAVALNSCTAALHLSILAAGIGVGDEVITTPLTFCATINAIIHSGATPVLADINPVTMNIDPAEVEAKITPQTKAILPVHFAGRPCEMDALCQIAEEYQLKIIEDCAHAIETEYHGQKVGTFGDFGCFSFYVTKNVITGEGGMVVTNLADAASRIKMLGLHGMSKDAWKRFGDDGYKHYQVVECGYKYNMTDLQAAIGVHQLRRVEENWLRRQEIWQSYNKEFANLPIIIPALIGPDTRHAYHLYNLLVDQHLCGVSRDGFINEMAERKIGTGVHYMSIPEHPYYQERFSWKPQGFPQAMRIGRQTVSLPLSAKMTDEEVKDVVFAVRDVLAG